MMVNPEFVYNMINSKTKAKAVSVYENSIFFFLYNIKTIDPGKFPNPNLCNINNFWPKTKVAVKLQIYSYNFKIKRQKRNFGYFFKLIELYKLQDIKIFLLSILEKRPKEVNKFMITPLKTKNIHSALNLFK